jgi:putative tricarboxylic transport membrane protein
MAGRSARRGDVVSGAVLAGLGLYIIREARRWEYLGADGPGPGFFPLWYGMAMLALALLLVGTSVGGGSAAPAAGRRRELARALVAWVALAACVALVSVLGFLIAFGLFTLFVVAVMYRRPVLPALAVAVGCAVAFYLVFPLALNVALPTGVFGF